MAVKVIGAKELAEDLQKVQVLLQNVELITSALDHSMKTFAHVDTGYLKRSTYHKGNVAGAKAPYAGHEEERGGGHAFATKAIETFDIVKYADTLMVPL